MNVCPQNLQQGLTRAFGIVLVCLFGATDIAAVDGPSLFDAYRRVIVLDPGHGGLEIGARGADGTEEKVVALMLAKLIAAELQRDYKVKLTRTDDYQVDLVNRTAMANHIKADAFVSLHTGGSLVYSTAGPKIYYHQIASQPFQGLGHNSDLQDGNTHLATPWDRVQTKYVERSRVLARMVSSRLNNLNYLKDIPLQGAPLVVLKGANMPAILIEIGYLTNPSDENILRNDRVLKDLAAEIARGIEDFLSQKDKIKDQ